MKNFPYSCKSFYHFIITLIISASFVKISYAQIQTNVPALKDVYKNDFYIGCLLSYRHVELPTDPKIPGTTPVVSATGGYLIQYHMNSMSPGNNMKPQYTVNISASAAAYNSASAAEKDYYNTHPVIRFNVDLIAQLDWAKRQGFTFRGHTLVWHNQTPGTAFFRTGFSATGAYLTKEKMTERLENYIKEVIRLIHENWPGMLSAIDVVNEAVEDNTGNDRTNNEWYTTFGDNSYIIKAFEFARKYTVQYGEQQIKLYYNDYNTHNAAKADGIVRVCTPVYQAGLLDGIGMQEHDALSSPTADQWIASYNKFYPICNEMAVTELDVDPATTTPSQAQLTTQANQYAALFKLFVERSYFSGRGKIINVSKDGLNDVQAFKQMASLWDTNNQCKPAYYASANTGIYYNQVDSLISYAETLNSSVYTTTSWQALSTTLNSAKTTFTRNYSSTSPAADSLLKAKNNLTAAIAGLLPAVAPTAAPLPLLPADNAVNQSETITLVCRKSVEASQYRWQVASDAAFANVISTKLTSDSSVTIGPLTAGAKYYWRVSAVNGLGESNFSVSYSFTVRSIPGAPVLVYPASNTLNVSVESIILKWRSEPLAAGYNCQLSVTRNFAALVSDKQVTDTTLTVTNLLNNTKYYWRVLGYNSSGQSAYSAVDSFTTIAAKPAVPLLASPANNAVNQPVSLRLTSRKSEGAVQYRWQVSVNSDFSSTVVNNLSADTVYNISSLTPGTKYYWRACGVNSGGESNFSEVYSFTVMSLPAVPLLASPGNGTDNIQADTVIFKWHASSSASQYWFQFANDESFGQVRVNKAVSDTVFQLTRLNQLTKYYWRVKSINSIGESSYSPVHSFTTASVVGVADNENIPNEFKLLQNYPNPFNPSTVISFNIPERSFVSLKIYNVLGIEIAELAGKEYSPGTYSITVSAAILNGISSGVYFYTLNAGSYSATKKMILQK